MVYFSIAKENKFLIYLVYELQDDPLIFDLNVDIRVNDFVNAAITQVHPDYSSFQLFIIINFRRTVARNRSKCKCNQWKAGCCDVQANVTRTNHIMWTMGDDFQYQYAESWFKEMDKLIHYVNKVNTSVSAENLVKSLTKILNMFVQLHEWLLQYVFS